MNLSSGLGTHRGILTGGSGNACVSRSGISTSTPIVTTCATAAMTRVTGLRVRLWSRDSNNESSSMFDLLLKSLPGEKQTCWPAKHIDTGRHSLFLNPSQIPYRNKADSPPKLGGDALALQGLGRSVQRRTVPINKERFASIYKERFATLNRPPRRFAPSPP